MHVGGERGARRMTPTRAVILAAGQGLRLQSIVDDRPKGLIEIGGEALVARSIRLLRAAGIDAITIVGGYRADCYRRFIAQQEGVDLVINAAYAASGSMASFAAALDAGADGNLLLLESDIIYEPRALALLLGSAGRDATLVSGPTHAGDEVWVHAPNGVLRGMSKRKSDLPGSDGEFVGITRLSAAAARLMREQFASFVAAHGHERLDYDTGGLAALARVRPLSVVVVPDLSWGEIDDEQQYQRIVSTVWPALQNKE
jgi:2-aminoethylphosphonate-pyruvate transaminase